MPIMFLRELLFVLLLKYKQCFIFLLDLGEFFTKEFLIKRNALFYLIIMQKERYIYSSLYFILIASYFFNLNFAGRAPVPRSAAQRRCHRHSHRVTVRGSSLSTSSPVTTLVVCTALALYSVLGVVSCCVK